MKNISIILLSVVALFFSSQASPYERDNKDHIDRLFEQAEEQSFDSYLADSREILNSMTPSPEFTIHEAAEDRKTTAIILCILLGGIGAHRLYLGSNIIVACGYCVTGALFSVLYWGDIYFLATEGTASFENSDRFISWPR